MLPVPEGVEPQGVYAGGGALCVADGLSDEVKAGSYGIFLNTQHPLRYRQYGPRYRLFPY